MKNSARRSIPYDVRRWQWVSTWTGSPPLTGSVGKWYAFSGDYMYMPAACSPDGYFHFVRYNKNTKVWSECNYPGPTAVDIAWTYGFVVCVGGSIYTVPQAGHYGNPVKKFNSVGSYTDIGSPNTGYSPVYSMISHNDKIYFAGGTNYKTVYEYQSGTTWNSIGGSTMSISTNGVYGLISHAGSLYAWGINKDNAGELFIYRWDGGTTWTSCGSIHMLHDNADCWCGVSDGVNFYLIFPTIQTGDTYLYTAPSTWTLVASMAAGQGMGQFNSAEFFEGRLLVAPSGTTDILYLDGNTWKTYTEVPFAAGDRIMVIDGHLMVQSSGLPTDYKLHDSI